jgi:hypothetical protein
MTETTENVSIYNSNPSFTVDIPPILKIKDYVTAHGYGVTATFDFTGIPAEYHNDMLLLIRLGGYALARPAINRPAIKEPKPISPIKRLLHLLLPTRYDF